jgi:hypothetical protein
MNMTMKNLLRLAACVTWSGAAISSSAPADAMIATQQSGSYAACSPAYEPLSIAAYYCKNFDNPGGTMFSYRQNIKLNGDPCSGGWCNPDSGVVYTTNIYGNGRKVTTLDWCGASGWNLYGLDTCAC